MVMVACVSTRVFILTSQLIGFILRLGEMAAFLPHKKGFSGYATRFVDPGTQHPYRRARSGTNQPPTALGFALGWNYLLKYVRTAIDIDLS